MLCSPAAGFLLVRPEPSSDAAEARDARDERWSALMAAAQAGDARAYDTLLRECLPLLRAVCRARLRDAADVEDAVQDALLTIHRVRHTYDPSRPFRPWLAAIAQRRALDRGRSRGRSAARELGIDAAGEVAAPGRDAEAELGLRMESARLRHAVGELPTAQRTALGLTKIEDLSLAEASGRSGMSVGALKVATHRALRSLRRRFGVEE
jgi:RNA polymerase sigma-70 factor (ECF subfamily)